MEEDNKEEGDNSKPYKITFKPRLYQQSIFYNSMRKNSLIVLPTGLGKTNIFLMMAIYRLNLYNNSKIVFLGPTRPLIEQYKRAFLEHTNVKEGMISVFTGNIPPNTREKEWEKSTIILSTPQGFENDLLGKRISLKNVSLLGFDEAHRAVGNYSYVWVAKQYEEEANFPRIIALTASPGSTLEKIKEICQNLFIENIQSRSYDDEDVKPYVKEIKTRWIEVKLPKEFLDIREYLYKCLKKRVKSLKALGMGKDLSISRLNKKSLLDMQSEVRKEISGGRAEPQTYKAISLLAEIMKIQHAVELIETQDIFSLKEYFERLHEQAQRGASKAVKNLIKDPDFKSANYLAVLESEKKGNHPKLEKLKEILIREFFDKNKKLGSFIKEKEKGNKEKPRKPKAIIFTQYRDSAVKIKDVLGRIEGLNPVLFVGQTKKANTGMSQKKQKEIINKFSENEYNVLISTSVGEEGLDIPKVDFVVFYEPVPSAIRHIQRRGRTGRQETGKVFVLVTKNTRDEGYRWSSYHREKGMHRLIQDIKKEGTFLSHNHNDVPKRKGDRESEEGFELIADFREKGSPLLKQLYNKPEINLKLETLKLGDFIVSNKVAVEFKSKEDFINSIIDGRLMEQIRDLKENYMKPVLLIQGQEVLQGNRINKKSVFGVLSAIILGFGVPVIFTSSYEESADLILSLLRREQSDKSGKINPHGNRKQSLISEAQKYLVASIPGINMGLAEPLLKRFSSIKNMANASIEELSEVEGIGKKKASQIYNLFNSRYEFN
jgi:Fanconi anemia group M protein